MNNLPDEDDTKFWWRCYIKVQTSSYSIDEWGDANFYTMPKPNVTLYWEWFPVLKITPKGVRLGAAVGDYIPQDRFVLREANKRYAAPTRAEALESLKARNARRTRFLRHQLNAAEIGKDWLSTAMIGELT